MFRKGNLSSGSMNCDRKNKAKVKNKIQKLGYSPRWITNYDTVLGSLPGGKRFEAEKKRLGKDPIYKAGHIKDCKEGFKLFPANYTEKEIKKWVKKQYAKRR